MMAARKSQDANSTSASMSWGCCWWFLSVVPPSMMQWPPAVAQKSPCESNRVIMGKESYLKPYQRGQDVGQEAPMRTPKRLYAEERIIYHPELLTCLHCSALLVMWNYLV